LRRHAAATPAAAPAPDHEKRQRATGAASGTSTPFGHKASSIDERQELSIGGQIHCPPVVSGYEQVGVSRVIRCYTPGLAEARWVPTGPSQRRENPNARLWMWSYATGSRGPLRGRRASGSWCCDAPEDVKSMPGTLAPEVIKASVQARSGEFERCYEAGLRHNPGLRGRSACTSSSAVMGA
jgi:hypothetical protein